MPPTIELSLMRCASNPLQCIFDECEQKRKLISISKEKRYEVLKNHRIYIPKRSKICRQHLDNGNWGNFVSLEFKFTRDYIEDMMDLLRETMNEKREIEHMVPTKKIKDYFGLSSTQFNELFDSLPTLHNFFPGNLKRAKTALLMYLCRLRKGDYCNRIYDFFNVSSRKNTSLIDKH